MGKTKEWLDLIKERGENIKELTIKENAMMGISKKKTKEIELLLERVFEPAFEKKDL